MKKIILLLFFIFLGVISYFLFFNKTETNQPTTQNQESTFPNFTQNNQAQNTSPNSDFQENPTQLNSNEVTENLSEEERTSATLEKNIAFWEETKNTDKIKEIIIFASTIDVESSLRPIELLLASNTPEVFAQIQEDEEALESFNSLLKWFVAGSNHFNTLSEEEKNEITEILNSVE